MWSEEIIKPENETNNRKHSSKRLKIKTKKVEPSLPLKEINICMKNNVYSTSLLKCVNSNLEKDQSNKKDKISEIIRVLEINPSNRSEEETKTVKDYLLSLNSFIKAMSSIKDTNAINIISAHVKHKSCSRNNFVFKYGDRGDNYYIILKGKVDIILAKPEVMALTKDEYFSFLLKLIRLNELELFRNCLHLNNSVYQLSEHEIETLHWSESVKINEAAGTTGTIINNNLSNSKDEKTKHCCDEKVTIKSRFRTIFDENDTGLHEHNPEFRDLESNSIFTPCLKNIMKKSETSKNLYRILKDTANNTKMKSEVNHSPEHDFEASPRKTERRVTSIHELNNTVRLNKRSKSIFGLNCRRQKQITPQEYIKMCIPDIMTGSRLNSGEVIKNVTILKYHNISTLLPGQTFGEVALLSEFNKRSATCICTEDSEFGILNKQIYNQCLRKADMTAYKNSVNILTNNILFFDYSRAKFKKYLFNHLGFKRISKGAVLLQSNYSKDSIHQLVSNDKVYFIKSGVFSINLTCSLLQVKQLLRFFRSFTSKLSQSFTFINPKCDEKPCQNDKGPQKPSLTTLLKEDDSTKNCFGRLYKVMLNFIKTFETELAAVAEEEETKFDYELSENYKKILNKKCNFEIKRIVNEGIIGLIDLYLLSPNHLGAKDVPNFNSSNEEELFIKDNFYQLISMIPVFNVECISTEAEVYEADKNVKNN